MSIGSEKKDNHPIIKNVFTGVMTGVILLVCTTLYNLVLAHIWPVTIHFGEYSLNNFIFIFVSIISSVLLAVIILSLEIYYVFNSLASAILNFAIPPDKRKKRKHRWYEYILDVFLIAAAGILYLMVWLASHNTKKEKELPVQSEEVQRFFAKMPPLRAEQKPGQKQESS